MPKSYDIDAMVHPIDGMAPPQPPFLGVRRVDATSGMPPMIGQVLSIPAWIDYVARYDFGPLAPSRLVLHHTYRPNEAEWRGLASMRGMQAYYRSLGWTAAPHIYAGPDGIWLFTPMANIGIHAGLGNGSLREGWYSIGLEMVGFFDTARPAGNVWAHARAVMGGLSWRLDIAPRQLISFHRDYTTEKSCPGWAVTKAWVWDEVAGWLTQQQDAPPPTPPILGAPSGTPQQAIAWLTPRAQGYTPSDVRVIVDAYQRIGERVGLDWFLAVAQCAHETGSLTSFWSQRPQRNPAGIGVTGQAQRQAPADQRGWAYNPQRKRWEAGISFSSWAEHAVPAHLGRLLAYALRDDQANPAQQALIDRALAVRPLPATLRGSATTWADLDGRWAVPGTDYGRRITALAAQMRGTE